MKVVKGNKIEELGAAEFEKLASEFEKVVVDLGTGDGKFVYKNALENPKTLFVGVDPAKHQMGTSSKKANRKKLNNALFVIGSLEQLPEELLDWGHASALYINYPWGTLLQAIAKPTDAVLETLSGLLETSGKLEIIFGYEQEKEPGETQRLELPELTQEYIEENIIKTFEQKFFKLEKWGKIAENTSWGRRLGVKNNKREFFKLCFIKPQT
jgi:16S rRNA (adenine(1408)-N(1))-methyltransferase